MPSRKDLQWIVIDDFSPGIWSPRRGAAQPAPHLVYFGYGAHKAPLGAADETGTFKCITSPSGALIPAPAPDYSFTQAMFNGAGTFPGGEARMAVLAATVIGPKAIAAAGPVYSTDWRTRADDLYITYGMFVNYGVGFEYQVDPVQYRAYAATPPTVNRWGPLVIVDDAAGNDFASPWWHAACDFAELVDYQAGVPVQIIVGLQQQPNGTLVANAMLTEPDRTVAAGANDTVIPIGHRATAAAILCAHQGRLLAASAPSIILGEVMGNNSKLVGANDISYWPVHDAQTGAVSVLLRPVEENQSGIRVMESVNASELVIIKATGGGAVISGDIANPTIKRMPGIASVGQSYCKPVNTPKGLVYGGDQGVYAWSGNDTSERISPQLDGAFWDPASDGDTVNRFGIQGKFTYLDPYVLCPNGWLYDTRFQSWWRLEDPVNHFLFFALLATQDGNFWAIPTQVDAVQTTAAEHYSFATPATSYKWLSQAMTPIPGQNIRVRDIMLMVEGHGTITLAATASEGTDTIAEASPSFNVTVPTVIRFNVSMETETIKLQVTSTSSGGGVAAPTIHGLRIGYEPTSEHASVN